jgi:hypothetical protein
MQIDQGSYDDVVLRSLKGEEYVTFTMVFEFEWCSQKNTSLMIIQSMMLKFWNPNILNENNPGTI